MFDNELNIQFYSNFYNEDLYLIKEDVKKKSIENITNLEPENIPIQSLKENIDVLFITNHDNKVPDNILESLSKMMIFAKVNSWKCLTQNSNYLNIDYKILITLGVNINTLKYDYLENLIEEKLKIITINDKKIVSCDTMEKYQGNISEKKIFWDTIKNIF